MITITLAPCPAIDKPFAAVATETVVITGAEVSDGLQVALFDGSGTCLAVADIKDAQATLDLDTQEAVDATAPVGPGEAVTAWLVVGGKTTHIATIPCKLIRNLIDDGAVHPSVPADRYPTVDELAKWLQEADAAADKVAEGATQAAQDAAKAEQAAKAAQGYASVAGESSIASTKAAQDANTYKGNAQAAAQVAQQARDNAQTQQQQATQQAANARSSATEAKNAQNRAQWAQEDAEKARDAAQQAYQATVEIRNAAQQSANAAAESATGAQQASDNAKAAKTQAEQARDAAQTAKTQAEAAKAGAESAKASAEAAATNAATSATNAASSATAADTSATKAEEAKAEVEETAEWAGRWKLEETNAEITGSDGLFLYTGKDTGFAGDGTHYFVLTAIDATTCRLQVFAIVYENSPFSVPPRHDLVLPFGIGDRINVYLAAAIMCGALFVRYHRTLYKFSLPDGSLIAKISIRDGYTAFNFRTGHILCDNNNVTRIYDADLVERTQKAGYLQFSTLFYLYGTSYATRNKRLEWLDDEDVWQAAVDADGEEMTCDSNVSGIGTLWKTFSVHRSPWEPSFTDATGKKRLCLNLFNGYQKWRSTGIAEDGTAVFTKNGTINKTDVNTTGVIGAKIGPGMVKDKKTTLLNHWSKTAAVIYALDYSSFVPPILEPPEGEELVNNIYWIHLIGRVESVQMRHNQIYAIQL